MPWSLLGDRPAAGTHVFIIFMHPHNSFWSPAAPQLEGASRSCGVGGFTLIELLLVVLLVGLLSGFLLVRGQGILERTYLAGMKNDLRNYAALQAAQRHHTGSFADGSNKLQRFSFSPDVFEHQQHTQPDQFFLVAGHQKTDQYCWIKYGVPTIDNGKIQCGNPPPPSPAPTADFEVHGTAVMSQIPLTLDGSVTLSGASPVASYDWALGDGSQAEGVSVGKVYADSGEYMVQLQVVNEEGWTDTVEKPLEVVQQWLYSPENLASTDWKKAKGVDVSSDGHTVTFESSSSRLWQSRDGTTDPGDNGNNWETFTLESSYQTFRVERTSDGTTTVFEVRARGEPGAQIRLLSDWNKECTFCSLSELTAQIAPGTGGTDTPIDIDYGIVYFK